MLPAIAGRIGGRPYVIFLTIGIGVASLMGCATDSHRPAPTITQEQVKSNADKSFERLKQEEKNRATGSEAAPY